MFQDFKDEVLDPSLQPDTNPRYTIKDNNGKVINDNVQIDMKTPVVQNPTPLNRANMRNLQGDLYTQDRYNTPTYSGNAMTLNLPLTSYEVGKVVKITAPATLTNPTLNINGLGAKTVNGNIISSKKYNLVFDGTQFLIQRTRTNASKDPIIITSSGNYTIDIETVYKVILVGGGGGGSMILNTYSDTSQSVLGGGAGGIIIDTYIPKSSTLSVTIGSAGSNKSLEASSAGTISGTDGGNTIIGDLIAYGGKGSTSYWTRNDEDYSDKVIAGKGGEYDGGTGLNGKNSTGRTNGAEIEGTGGVGFKVEGIEYGTGGSYVAEWDNAVIVSNTAPKKGVAVLYPLF